jgi:Spy/CpxP family protein refolding chaperone
MKPWLKRTLIGLFGATALIGSLGACSHGAYSRGHWSSMSEQDIARFKARAVEKAAGKLDLDADQQAKLSALLDRLQEQRVALRGAGDTRSQLAALINDATFDRWHAQDLVNTRLNAVRDKSPQVIAASDFYDSLRPVQQQKLRDLLQRWGARRWGS